MLPTSIHWEGAAGYYFEGGSRFFLSYCIFTGTQANVYPTGCEKKRAGTAPLGNAGAIQGLLKINGIFMEIEAPAFLLRLSTRSRSNLT